MKMTKSEKNARAMCAEIQSATADGGMYPLTVEWIKSNTWGHNPRIRHRGGKCTSVSGSGYCKHSAALVEALQYLGDGVEEQHTIARKAGAGVSSVAAALAAAGWKLESVASGKNFDCYQVSRLVTP